MPDFKEPTEHVPGSGTNLDQARNSLMSEPDALDPRKVTGVNRFLEKRMANETPVEDALMLDFNQIGFSGEYEQLSGPRKDEFARGLADYLTQTGDMSQVQVQEFKDYVSGLTHLNLINKNKPSE